MIRISKEKRDKLILVAIGAVAIIAGLWLGVVKTRREQIGLSQTKLEKAMEKLENARKMVSRSAQAEADMEAASTKLSAIEDIMASGDLYSWARLLMERACHRREPTWKGRGRPAGPVPLCGSEFHRARQCLLPRLWEIFS